MRQLAAYMAFQIYPRDKNYMAADCNHDGMLNTFNVKLLATVITIIEKFIEIIYSAIAFVL